MGIVANSIAKEKAANRQNNRQKAMQALASAHAPKYSNFDDGYTRAIKEADSRANIESGLNDYMAKEKIASGEATPSEIGQYRANQNEPYERQAIEQSLANDFVNSSLGSELTNQTIDNNNSLSNYLSGGNRNV